MTAGRVRFSDVWKRFRYGEVHDRLRDLIPAMLTGRRQQSDELGPEEFWALRDVSFDIGPGQVLGVIGPNGAGKSTVLKLLTGILRPTRGSCSIRGRFGALIEVAAGFHPDLTGRENVFLQGAIMGMPRAEIARKFDEIVAFAGVEWFIDTPVKRYSSGMHARLGFAVAAHLDPDVLVIDEVLSVGDAAFQRKAYGRIGELVDRQIPVVIVSHQLEAIAELCTETILLHEGGVVRRGSPRECIAAYLGGAVTEPEPDGNRATAMSIRAVSTSPAGIVASGSQVTAAIDCTIDDGDRGGDEGVGVRIRSCLTGEVCFETGTIQVGVDLPRRGPFGLALDLQLNVRPGVYALETFVWNGLAGRALATGPTAYLEVAGGPEFDGPIQMNPRMRIQAG